MKRAIIQCSCLGKMGRWGNQLHQYAFSKAYADSQNCILEIPSSWFGRELFGLDHPPLRAPLPLVHESRFEVGMTNVNVFGFFQSELFLRFVTRSFIRKAMKITDSFLQKHKPVGLHCVSAHLRRGDYLTDPCLRAEYVTVSDESYRRAYKKFGVQESQVRRFGDDLTPGQEQPNFIGDFIGLIHSKIIFRSNSTFAWWAGTFAELLFDSKLYSPVIDGLGRGMRDCEFVDGNHPRMHHSTANMVLNP